MSEAAAGVPAGLEPVPMSRRGRRQVRLRYSLVAGAAVYTALLLAGAAGGGLLDQNGWPVAVLTVVLLGSCLLWWASLHRRVRQRSARLGIGALGAALLVLVVSFLGLLTIGPFILPVALVGIVAALPLEKMYA